MNINWEILKSKFERGVTFAIFSINHKIKTVLKLFLFFFFYIYIRIYKKKTKKTVNQV